MGQHLFLYVVPNNFTDGTGRKVWCDRGMREQRTLQFFLKVGKLAVVGSPNEDPNLCLYGLRAYERDFQNLPKLLAVGFR